MPFPLKSFSFLRPFLYHLTSADNLDSIRSTRRLRCAAEFIRSSGQDDLLQRHRKESCSVQRGGVRVRLQGQSPLHAGNIAFEGGWSLNDLIEHLNGLVFFWPGSETGPSRYGMNHFESSSWGERPVVLKTGTTELFDANPAGSPLFCRFNSGSPRWSNGQPSPRGHDTFLPANKFEGSPSKVVEVVFPEAVALPEGTQWGPSPAGPWRRFF